MPTILDAIAFPELIFGIVGPIGMDLDAVCDTLKNRLRDVNYIPQTIKLTDEMFDIPFETTLTQDKTDFYHEVKYKIEYANALRRDARDPAKLARIALKKVIQIRRDETGGLKKLAEVGMAFIIRQLKRPEEVDLLRKIYGRQFILISAFGPVDSRRHILERRLKMTLSTQATDHQIRCLADELIEIDAEEKDEDYGQRLRDTFHLGDLFVDGIHRQTMDRTLTRFVNGLFGQNDISPTKAEYGMYAAKSASLRSADLSRQVGAAIFTDDGELVSQGCNEVPKAFGGTYWDSEEPDFRDIKLGRDPNEFLRHELLRDLFERLAGHNWLSEKALGHGSAKAIVDAATKKTSDEATGGLPAGPLAAAAVMDLTEYGRIVHAEMCAICDAARLGRPLRGTTLYCTTFPCHNCTKHILASGIRRVIYIEPYPKSKAKDLHENEIAIDHEDPQRVAFIPFLGISPLLYRDIFQKGKRKDKSGAAERWYRGRMRPMIDILVPDYLNLEALEAMKLLEQEENPPKE